MGAGGGVLYGLGWRTEGADVTGVAGGENLWSSAV